MTAWNIRDIQVYSSVEKFRSSLLEAFYKEKFRKFSENLHENTRKGVLI